MAEAVNVGKLVITISGDTKELEAAASRIGKSLQGVQKDVQSTARTAVASFTSLARSILPAVTAAAAVTVAIRSFFAVIEQTTALDNLSQSTGISVQRLAELRAIALQTGIQFETLSQVVSQFGARMSSELASPASRGSQAIRALGIDVRDAQGNIRQLDELLPDLADRFSRFADGSNKAALAAALFGEEAGPRLVPLLNRGRAGLEDLRRSLGTTISQDDIERAREYQRTVGQLQLAFENLVREFVRTFGPQIVALGNAIAQSLRNMRTPDTFREEMRRVQEDIDATTSRITTLQGRLQDFGRPDDGVRSPLNLYNRVFGQTKEQVEAEINELNAKLQALKDRLDVLKQRSAGEFTTEVIPERPQAPALDHDALLKAQFALDQLMERLTSERLLLDELNFAWLSHADIVAMANEKIAASGQSRTQQDITRARLQQMLAKQEQTAILNTASMLAQTITAIWPQQKGAAIAAAIINTAVAVTKALTSGIPPWNFAQAALVAAQGAAQIAQIRNTNKDGSGSAPSVGGGAAAPAAPEAAPPGRAITIQGVDRAMWYSGAALEELLGLISMEVKNGATLISSGVRPT